MLRMKQPPAIMEREVCEGGIAGLSCVRGREKKVSGPSIVYVCIAVLWIAIWVKMARDEARAEEEPRGPESFFD